MGKLEDAYDDFVVETAGPLKEAEDLYRDGYEDGAYDFFSQLLGAPK